MREALWSVKFSSSLQGFGDGIVVMETGRLFGGDSAMIYTGTCKVVNGVINARLNVKRYGTPAMQSVTGLDNFSLELTGNDAEDDIVLNGYVVGAPNITLKVQLKHQADLP